MDTILNWTSPHLSPKIVDNINYSYWNSQRALFSLSGVSSLTIFVVLAGIITLAVKRIPAVIKDKHVIVNTNVSGQSSIARVPWLVLLKYMWEYSSDLPKVVTSLNQRYGSAWKIVIFGKNLIFLNSAESLQKLLSSGEATHLKKPTLLYDTVMIGSIANGLAFSDVTTWKIHRNILNKGFTYESLRNYVRIFEEQAKKLILTLDSTLANIGQSSEETEDHENSFHNIIHYTAFSNILQIVTGSNIVSDDEKKLINKLFDRCKEIVSYRIYHPWLVLFKWLWKIHPQKKELDRCAAMLESINVKVMERTREIIDAKESAGNSLVELMIRGGLSNKEISSEVATFLLLGHETVSMSTNLLMFNLGVNIEYQEKCREEIDQLFDKLDPMNENLSLESLSDLKYLDKCIKENLRLYPTAPVLAREIESPLVIDENTLLQPGDIVSAAPYFLHRRAEYFPNPTEFNPERFSVENCQSRNLYEYIPFSMGKRDCIGWKFATLETKVLAAYILRNFEVYSTNPKDHLVNEFDKCIWPIADVGVRLRRR